MHMDIHETRRANLKKWLETHTTPPAEKSLFSQLKGTGSFGEKVARRLELKYEMGVGYLDRPGQLDGGSNSPINDQNPPLSDEAQALIRCVERLDGSGPEFAQMFAAHARLLALAEHVMGMHDAGVVREKLQERKQKLAAHADRGTPHHAKRDRRSEGSN